MTRWRQWSWRVGPSLVTKLTVGYSPNHPCCHLCSCVHVVYIFTGCVVEMTTVFYWAYNCSKVRVHTGLQCGRDSLQRVTSLNDREAEQTLYTLHGICSSRASNDNRKSNRLCPSSTIALSLLPQFRHSCLQLFKKTYGSASAPLAVNSWRS